MKKLTFIILLLSLNCFAAEAPSYLKDATVTVTLKGGKTYTYSANEYAVVVRTSMDKSEPMTQTPEAKTVEASSTTAAGPNTFRAFVGVGPSGFSTTTTPGSVSIEQDYGALFGVGYSRQFTPRWSLEVVGLSNKTGIMGAGYSF